MSAELYAILRYAVAALVGLVALGALAAMAVQRRMISPFGRPARVVRDLTDPLLKPMERRILRGGGNPQNAPWWLLGIAIVAGIVLLTLVRWIVEQVLILSHAAGGGPRSIVVLLIQWTFNLLIISLIVRVIGSWVGVGRYNRWMRPFYVVTEWMLGPLRRVLPAFGPFDISPIVAYLLLSVVRSLVMSSL